jgi:hypothetical protein
MRAKFRVSSIAETKAQDGSVISERLMFDAVYSPDPNSENAAWAKYTPYGHLEMVVDNPNLFGHFTPGQELYLDFIPVAQPVESAPPSS